MEACRRELRGRAPSGEESAGPEGPKKKLSETFTGSFPNNGREIGEGL